MNNDFSTILSLHLEDYLRDLVNWLLDKHNIVLAGLEKSGVFVDHAQSIQQNLEPGKVLILTDDYIYRYILPGPGDPQLHTLLLATMVTKSSSKHVMVKCILFQFQRES